MHEQTVPVVPEPSTRLGAMFSRFRRSTTATGTSLMLVFVAVGSLLTLGMYSLAARHLGPEQFGVFSTWFNTASFLTAVALLGQESLISRTWNEYLGSGDHARARGALLFGYAVTIAGGIAIGLLLLAAASTAKWNMSTAVAAAVFLATQAVFHYTTYASQAIIGIVAGEGQGQIAWRTLVLAAVAIAMGLHLGMDAASLLYLIAATQIAVAVFQSIMLTQHLRANVPMARPVWNWKEWSGRARHMTFAGVMEAATQFLDVILVGILVDAISAGAYFVASRIANIFFRVGTATTSYASRSVPPLVYSHRYEDIQGVLKWISLVGAVVVGTGLAGLAVAGSAVLAMFGPVYVSEYWTLLVLALGPSMTVILGPARTVLLSMGHERVYARIVGSGLIARILLTIGMTLALGTLGTAIAWTISATAVGVALNLACRKLEGLDPSVLGLIWRTTPKRSAAASEAQATAANELPITGSAGPMRSARGAGTTGISATSLADCERAPRLLMFQPHAQFSGTQEIARLIESGLQPRGYHIEQVYLYRKSPAAEIPAHWRICSETKSMSPIAMFKVMRALVAEIRRSRPDVVMCFEHYGNIIGGVAARFAGVTKIVGNLSVSHQLIPTPIKLIDGLLGTLGVYSRVVVNSAAFHAEMGGYPEAYRQRIVRIDNCFQPKSSSLDRSAARALHRLPEDAVVLGSVARLHPTKNLANAVRLLPLEPTWHLALAGEGPDREALAKLAEQLGCADRLHFAGELAPCRVGDFLAALDVFVFPSRSETFGLAPIEAAHAGIPVVANDLPVLREVMATEAGFGAVLVDTEDVATLAAAVKRIVEDPAAAEALKAASRLLAQKYSPERMIAGYGVLLDGFRSQAFSVTHASQPAASAAEPVGKVVSEA